MALQVKNILDCLDQIAPFDLAESWDNVGLLVGRKDQSVRSILIGLDSSLQLLNEAIERKCDLILTHHPFIFHPLRSISTDSPSGIFIQKSLQHGIAVIACHTNLDSAIDGVSDALAAGLKLTDVVSLIPGTEQTGLGRIGAYNPPITGRKFLACLFDTLNLPTLMVAGKIPDMIGSVALCGGSGSDLAETAKNQGADLYLSAEIKHSTARWAEDSGFCVIDGTHYATEQPMVAHLAKKIRVYASSLGWNIEIKQTKREMPPFAHITRITGD